ncbi:hypothetical protein [Allorhodopirellula solitaria]|uniref:Uncharacterized protein n=1 Tax=Allorhodopirellula solitaria TaxID=2527987 RepID=A0A5C5XU07_9BACT|nr:hypothetical protein [Allorhodopirellula solitaria]TWT66039.1 hypothetical protein CA85_29010 [Allorhodopirellula solitaria]
MSIAFFPDQPDRHRFARVSVHRWLLTIGMVFSLSSLSELRAQDVGTALAADENTAEIDTAEFDTAEHDSAERIAQVLAAMLESAQFSQRETATRDLWRIGLPARAALELVRDTGSPDARLRASRVLEDFNVGILPTTSAQDRDRIRQFRHGSPSTRLQMLPDLLADLPIPWIEGLIVSEDQPDMRRRFIGLMFSDPKIRQLHRSVEAIAKTVNRNADGMGESWSRDTIAWTLAVPEVISEIVNAGNLSSITGYVAGLPAEDRTATLSHLCQNPEPARSLILSGNSPFLFELLEQAEDGGQAAGLAVTLFQNPTVVESIVLGGEFDDLVDELERRFGTATSQQILIASLENARTIAAMLAEMGWKRLRQWVERIDDPTSRITCLAHVMSERRVFDWLKSNDNIIEVLSVAEEAGDADLREIYLKMIVTNGVMVELVRTGSSEVILGIWELIAPLEDAELQGSLIEQLMATSSLSLILKNRSSGKAILDIIASLPAQQFAASILALEEDRDAILFFADSMLLSDLIAISERIPSEHRARFINTLTLKIAADNDDIDTKIRGWMDSAAELEPAERVPFIASLSILPMTKGLAGQLVKEVTEEATQGTRGQTLTNLSLSQNQAIGTFLHTEHCSWVIDTMQILADSDLELVIDSIVVKRRHVHAYLDQAQLARLVQQIIRLDDSKSQDAFSKLLTWCPKSTLTDPDTVNQLTEVIVSTEGLDAKQRITQWMLQSEPLMQTVIEIDQLGVFVDAVASQSDRSLQLRSLSELCRHGNAHRALLADEHLETLLSVMDDQWLPRERERFISVLAPGNVMREMSQADRFDSLVQFLTNKREDAETSAIGRGMLAGKLMEDYRSLQSLIEHDRFLEVFDIAEKAGGVTARLALQLCNRRDVLAIFDEAERLTDLMDAVVYGAAVAFRSDIDFHLFRSGELVRLLLETNRKDVIEQYIRGVTDDRKRTSLLRSLVQGNRDTELFIRDGHLQWLWDLVESQSPASYTPLFKSYLAVSAYRVGHSLSPDRWTKLYRDIDLVTVPKIRNEAVESMMSVPITDTQSGRHLDQLLAWIDAERNAGVRNQWVARLLLNAGPAKLIDRRRDDLLRTIVQTDNTSTSVVKALLRDEEAVNSLRDAGLFEPFMEHFESAANSRALMFQAIQSPYACQHLDREKRVYPWIRQHLAEQKQESGQYAINQMSSNGHLLGLIIDAGELKTLRQSARALDAKNAQYSTRSAELSLMMKKPCLEYLLREERTGELIRLARSHSNPRRELTNVRHLASNKHVVAAIAEGGGLKKMVALIDGLDSLGQDQSRQIEQFLMGYGAFSYWAGYGDRETLTSLFNRLRQDQSRFDQMTRSFVSNQVELLNHQVVEVLLEMISLCGEQSKENLYQQLLHHPRLRWQMVDAGWQRDLLDVAKLTSQPQTYNEAILFSPTGVVANRISKKKFDAAEKLLAEYANHEKGYSRLAAFYLLRGVLPARIAELESSQPNSPILAFLLKCGGQFDAGADVAVASGDPGLATRILMQGERWQAAADLEQKRLQQPSDEPLSPNVRIEILSRLAILQHHAGRDLDCQQSCDELLEIAKSSPAFTIKRLCCNVLLLTDRIEPAIQLAQESDRPLQLALLGQRGEYTKAFETVGLSMDNPQGWFHGLMEAHPQPQQKIHAIREAVQVCELLDQSGNRSQADVIFKKLEELFSSERPERSHGRVAFRPTPFSMDVDRALLRSGRLSMLWPRVAAAIQDSGYPSAYLNLNADHRDTGNELFGWWEILNPELFQPRSYPSNNQAQDEPQVPLEKTVERLQILHDLLSDNGKVTIDGKTINTTDYIKRQFYADGRPNRNRRQSTSALLAMLRLGNLEQATDLFEDIGGDRNGVHAIPSTQYGWILYKLQRWAEAVDPLYEQWSGNPASPVYRYLSAEALAKSGEKLAGREMRQIASMMAVGVNDRFQLITRLDSLGFPSLAIDEAKVMHATAPTQQWVWFDVCKRLSETESDHERIAALIQCHLLRYAQPTGRTISLPDLKLLHHPHLHRAAVAIQDGDYEDAQRHIDTVLEINRVDPEIGGMLIPLLQEAGREGQATVLRERLETVP